MAEKVFWAELSDLDMDFILNDETLLDEFMQAKGSTPVHRISPSPGDLNGRFSVDGETNMHSTGAEEERRDRGDNETEAKARLMVSEPQDSSTGTNIMENTGTGGSANAGIGVMAGAISHTKVEKKVDGESVGSSSSSQIRRAAAIELIKQANAELKPSGFYASNHSERQSDQQQPLARPTDTVVGLKRKADPYTGNEIKREAASVETRPEEEKVEAKSSIGGGQGTSMNDGKVGAAVRSRVRFLVNIEDDEDDEDDREGGVQYRIRDACWTDSRQSIVTADRVNTTTSGSSSVDHRSYGHYSIDSGSSSSKDNLISNSNKSSSGSSSASTTTTSSDESTTYNNNHTISSLRAAGSGSLSKRDSGFWTSLDSLDMKFLANEELALEEYQRFTWGQQQSKEQRSASPSSPSHSYLHPPHSHLLPRPHQQREVNASESYYGTAGGVVGRVGESLSSAHFHHQNPPQVALQVDNYQNLRTYQQRLQQLQTQHQNQEQKSEPNQRDGENMDRFSGIPRTTGLQSVYRAPAPVVSPNSSLYGYHQQHQTQHPPEVASRMFPQPQLRVQQPMGNAHAQHLSSWQAAAPQSSQSFSVPPHAHFASGSNHDINNSSNNIINNNNNVKNDLNLNNNYNSNNHSDNSIMNSSINSGISIRNSNLYNNSDLLTSEAAVGSEPEFGTAAIAAREFPDVTGAVAAPVRTGDIRERWVFPSVAINGRLVAGSSSNCTSTSNSTTINSASSDGGGGGGNGNGSSSSSSWMPVIPQYDHLANANALIQHHLQFLRNQSTSFGRTGVAVTSAGGSGKSRGKSKSTDSQKMQRGIISRAQPVVAPDLSQSTSMRDVSKGISSNSSGSNHTSREIIRKTEASHDPAPVETPSSAALAVAAVAAATAAVAVAVAAGNKGRSNDISIGAGRGMTLTGNERGGSAAGLLYDAAAATELLVRQSMLSAGRKYDQRRKRRKTSASSTTGTKKSESKSMKKEVNTSVSGASVPSWAPSSPRAQTGQNRNSTIAATELVTETECIHPDSRDNRIISSSSNNSSFMMMRNDYELANAKKEAYEGGTDGTEAGGKAGTGAVKWIDKAIISNRSSRGSSDGSAGETVVEIGWTDSDIKTVFTNANRVQQAFTAQLVGALNAGSWSKLQQVHRKYCTPGLTASIRYLSGRKAESGKNATEEPRVSSLHAIIEGLLGGEEMWSKLFKAAPDFLITILSSKLDTAWRSEHNARADEHSFTCSFELSATSLKDTGSPSDAGASDDEEEETRRNTEFNAGVEAKNERDLKAISRRAFSRAVRKTTEEIHCVGSLFGKLNKENRITAYEFSYEDAAVSSLSSATG